MNEVPLIASGAFAGVPTTDAFALAAQSESPVIFKLPAFTWPDGYSPAPAALGSYTPGQAVTGPLRADADVLVILYTEHEIQAFLEVFTGHSAWDNAARAKWHGYGHNFEAIKPKIRDLNASAAFSNGWFGYLAAFTVGTKKVVAYKTELHPKQDGPDLPFIEVIKQLVTELNPGLVLSTGTAGAVGNHLKIADVMIASEARFHLQNTYPAYPGLTRLSTSGEALMNTVALDTTYLDHAQANYMGLALTGLNSCFQKLHGQAGYGFLTSNTGPATIYMEGRNEIPPPQPNVIVSADYLTVDDATNAEGLQALGGMNDTDDAFAFYAINSMASPPKWLSIRNASEPQIVGPGDVGDPSTFIKDIKALAGKIYGVYQYATTINSAFACWAAIAGS